ncbi:MAG: hypothetical protein EOO07_16650 [Chitinophagaceae bacterium]|nr:MAG: hypothetical protein EOO07_16650 [Chitinophagaceae bacterium]
METGTGKTYVYLRTIFELSQKYGFKKFIIVVPSVAIREGTLKNIEITADHFRALYNNIAFEHFVYDSKKANRLRQFATSNQLQIMIINIDVPDLTTAIKFYCAALDLQLKRILDDDVAELVGGSSVIYLLCKNAETPINPNATMLREYSRHWTPVHIDFVVDNIIEATNRALAAGAIKESECIEWRGSTCITFSDPFGHGFCFIQFLNQTYQ